MAEPETEIFGYARKRGRDETLEAVQAGNRAWWTRQTMSYDWKGKVQAERFSAPWFAEIDRRFIDIAGLYGHAGDRPFAAIIPFDRLAGKRVLEIGCGMGLHSELMARAGAEVTAVDISDTSITATRARADLKGLQLNCQRMDATQLQFADATFDFVWSWGAIHHSARTGRIVREIDRVLKPGGETRLMVYNLGGMPAYIAIVTQYLFGFWRGRSLDECLWKSSDGYMARFFTADHLADVLGTFFDSVTVTTLGQAPDAVPLPRYLRNPIVRLLPGAWLARQAHARGAFLLATAIKPARSG